MDTILIPGESEFKQWIREAIKEYFESTSPSDKKVDEQGESLLSRKEIVRHLDGITLVTLHAWMKRGLPYHKQEGRVYFLKSEVLNYIKAKKNV